MSRRTCLRQPYWLCLSVANVLLGVTASAYARPIYVLTTTNGIATVDDSSPGMAGATLPITLAAGVSLVAIDVRPQNNRLYGLGYNSTTSSVQLYLIEIRSGNAVATLIGPSGTFVDVLGFPVPIAGSAFDIDFDPSHDRLRVITSTGQSFRMNPNSGEFIDGNFGFDGLSYSGLNTDGSANGASTKFDAVAYTNNQANASATTLYAIDAASDRLFIVDPPNLATLTSPKPLTLGGNNLDVSTESGFDIPNDLDVAANNVAASGFAYGAFTAGGVSSLYKLNLTDATTTLVGSFGGLAVRDIAIASLPTAAQSLVTSGLFLQRFLVRSPIGAVRVDINGVSPPQVLVGLALRPSTGQWIALAVDSIADRASLYRIDPQTGFPTLIGGSVGAIAFTDGAGVPVDFASGTYGVSFDPVSDLVRVIASNGLNFRANPATGSGIDGDFGHPSTPTPLMNPDGAINGIPPFTGADGAAYSSNFAGASVTTMYTLDAFGDRLLIQNPPDSGNQTQGISVSSQSNAVDFAPTTGFSIPPGPAAPASNLPVNGTGYAILTIDHSTRLYRIGLGNGVLQEIGPIGAGAAPSAGLVVSDEYVDSIFEHGFD